MQTLAALRRWHAQVAPFVLAPLLLTAATGMGYRLLRDWGGLSRDQAHLLMVLHEGEWLGSTGKTFYVALNGLGLLWMLISGGAMVAGKWQRATAARRPAGPAATSRIGSDASEGGG
jgi:hypothetical protein